MDLGRVFELASMVLEDGLRDAGRAYGEHPEDGKAKDAYMSARKELTDLCLLRLEVYDGSFPCSPKGPAKEGCSPLAIFTEASMAAKEDVKGYWKEMEGRGMLTGAQVEERTAGALWAVGFMKMHLARLTGFYLRKGL